MSRFVEVEPRTQSLLFPKRLDDWISEDNPVRVIDAFVEELDLKAARPRTTVASGWEHEAVLEAMQRQLDRTRDGLKLRRSTVEHPFATIKVWMGATHFLTKTLPKVRTEMSLHVLAYNLKRAMKILGTRPLIQAIRA